MSSIIDRSVLQANVTANGQAASRVVEFDATIRRKEKMRQRAAGDPQTPAAKNGNGAPVRVAVPSSLRNAVAEESPARPAEQATPEPLADKSAVATLGEPAHEAATPLDSQELENYLVEFVVEQTGYPEEMVELDADLEADLGIDSIKKAQLFGELAEHFQVDVQGAEELSLDDFPTLHHVMHFLQAASPGQGSTQAAPNLLPAVDEQREPIVESPAVQTSPAATPVESKAAPAALSGIELEQFLIGFVVEQTGYPEEMVELDADLEADLGIDSIKKAQLFGELAEHCDVNIQSAEEMSLDDFPTLRHVLEFLEGAQQQTAATSNPTPAKTVADSTGITAAQVNSVVESPSAADPQPAGLHGAEMEQFLINFVVEQTGYPEEMVELDADLEADLGIDSIKKTQLFGELAEHFDVNMQSAEELSLDDFPTLRHVMTFLEGSSGQSTPPVSSPVPQAAPVASGNLTTAYAPIPTATDDAAAAAMSGAELEEFLINFVVEQTGYPPEMVELDADLEADLGIDSIKKAQLFGELAEQFEVNIESAEEMSLDDYPTLRHVMVFLEGAPQRATA